MRHAILFISMLFLASCNTKSADNSNKAVTSKIQAEPESEDELKKELSDVEKEEQKRLKELEQSMTTMSFDRLKHDFGKVVEESDNKTTFIVKNTGKKPLMIESVSASCGCTTPTKPEKPIQPGKNDKIEVLFHPKPGQLNEQNKTVTVIANTEPKMAVLNISAFVLPKK